MNRPDEEPTPYAPILDSLDRGPYGVDKITDLIETAQRRLPIRQQVVFLGGLPGSGKSRILRAISKETDFELIPFEDALRQIINERPPLDASDKDCITFYEKGSRLQELLVVDSLRKENDKIKLVTAPTFTAMVTPSGMRGWADTGAQLAYRLSHGNQPFRSFDYDFYAGALQSDDEVRGLAELGRTIAADNDMDTAKEKYIELGLPPTEIEEEHSLGKARKIIIERYRRWSGELIVSLIADRTLPSRKDRSFDEYVVEEFFPFYFGKRGLNIPRKRTYTALNRVKPANPKLDLDGEAA